MTTKSDGISSQLPKVIYVMAIDVWLMVCLLFVVGSFLEYSVVNVLSRRDSKRSKKQKEMKKIKHLANINGNFSQNGYSDVSINIPKNIWVNYTEKPFSACNVLELQCNIDIPWHSFGIIWHCLAYIARGVQHQNMLNMLAKFCIVCWKVFA